MLDSVCEGVFVRLSDKSVVKVSCESGPKLACERGWVLKPESSESMSSLVEGSFPVQAVFVICGLS